MKLEEKIGQLLMIGFSGAELNKQTRDFCERNHIGGFILFERNYKSLPQLINLTSELHEISKGTTPLIAVDQEGGRVIRFREPFTQIPPANTIGKLISRDKDSVKISYEIGKIIGSELSVSGVNMNLAPVLDLHTNARNMVIGDRSFGSDPILVSQIGLSMVAGMQDQHVIACGKHFPGHGDTEDDSHKVLPVVQHDIKRLLSVEIRPFSHCVKNGMLSVMTAHVKYEKIDNQYPASISEIIVGKLLRKSLRFTGIVITDDLGMGAIKKNYSVEESALLSIKAGADIVMVCNDIEVQKRVYESLLNAVLNKKIEETRINESVARILRIKNQFLLPFKSDVKKAAEVVGNNSHRKFMSFLEAQMKGLT
jgi:beta-N-acetylhexosaminidase